MNDQLLSATLKILGILLNDNPGVLLLLVIVWGVTYLWVGYHWYIVHAPMDAPYICVHMSSINSTQWLLILKKNVWDEFGRETCCIMPEGA